MLFIKLGFVLAVVTAAPQFNETYCAQIKKYFPKTKCNPPTTTTVSTTVTESPYVECVTDQGIDGYCVFYYQCDSGKYKIGGNGLIDPRLNNNPCLRDDFVCCVVPDVRDTTESTTSPPNLTTAAPNPTTPSLEPQVKNQGCGWSNPNSSAISTTSDNGEFPWIVAVYYAENIEVKFGSASKPARYICGGSLIHSRAVLTSAHNVASIPKLKVRAGESDKDSEEEDDPYQERNVISKLVHENFHKANLYNDIAILFLESPMELTPSVGVVCLPQAGQRVPGGTRCLAASWTNNKRKGIIKKVELPVVERNQCQEAMRKTRAGPYFVLHESFMCAGGEPGKDVCKGSGGSPLICPIEFGNNRYIQSGLTSWGIDCGKPGSPPGTYTDVSHLRVWIDDKIAGLGLDSKVYTI